jgi:hypothetical protein
MKYLKKFMEELSPDTYRRAGQILKDKGKPDRGSKLINFSDELESGFYNIRSESTNHIITCTRPRSTFYYGDLTSNIIKNKNYNDVDDLINAWLEGDDILSFTLNFDFYSKDKMDSVAYNNDINMFSVIFVLNNWDSGKNDQGPHEEFDFDQMDVYDFYYETKDFSQGRDFEIYLKPGFYIDHEDETDYYFFYRDRKMSEQRIFADRKSAIKFKKVLINAIKENRDNIIDIFSIIGTEVDEWDIFMKSVNDIRINNLYIDDYHSIKRLVRLPLN